MTALPALLLCDDRLRAVLQRLLELLDVLFEQRHTLSLLAGLH